MIRTTATLAALALLAACGQKVDATTDDDGNPVAADARAAEDAAPEAPDGPAAPGAEAPQAAPEADAGADGLKVGEYACYGSGGTPLIGLGFKVTAPGRYTDLDGGNAGRYRVSGSTVTFTGGHLDGQSGRDLRNGQFTIGSMAGCEPW